MEEKEDVEGEEGKKEEEERKAGQGIIMYSACLRVSLPCDLIKMPQVHTQNKGHIGRRRIYVCVYVQHKGPANAARIC